MRLTSEQRKKRIVGTLLHTCGNEIPVYQNARTHLYLLCPVCGADQRNDAATQTEWFNAMKPLQEGAPLRRPRNVPSVGAPPIGTPPTGAVGTPPETDNTDETRATPAPVGDVTDAELTETAPIGAPPKTEPGKGGWILLAIASAVGGLAMILSGSAGAGPATTGGNAA